MKKIFLKDSFILALIIIYSIIVFINGFEHTHKGQLILDIIDNIITILFIIELYIKIKLYSFKEYLKNNWNKLDFILVILSVPSVIAFIFTFNINDVSFLLTFRILRIFKSFRFLRFIPGISQLLAGIKRALKASILVLIGFVLYIFIIGIFSFYLFKNVSPEYFGDPAVSLYSIFKIFTVEGWFEIPEHITLNLSETYSFLTYMYFIFVLLTGGIFGLSLVNSIFVDAMISDNNDDLEQKIDVLNGKVDKLLNNE